jgi:hypothetical protein
MTNKILGFQEFLNESLKNNLVNQLLEAIEPTVEEMKKSIVEAINSKNVEEGRRKISEWEIQMIGLNLTYDLVRSIEQYTLPTDILVDVKTRVSVKKNIEITAVINRDGVEYSLATEAIYAGGYNIQTLHYRYITKTNLPKTGQTTVANSFKEKIKKMNKIQRLESDLRNAEMSKEKAEKRLEIALTKTEEDILNDPEISGGWKIMRDLTWEEVVRRGADKNYPDGQEGFYKSKEESRQRALDFHQRVNIDMVRKNILDWEKNVKRAKLKLDTELDKID